MFTTTVDEIAPDIFRLSTLHALRWRPTGLVFNQFLIRDAEPMLFHTGYASALPVRFRGRVVADLP